MLPQERIIPALDYLTLVEVETSLTSLSNAQTVKIDCVWREILPNYQNINFFVDEKYFDIPQTVTRKIKRLIQYPNVKMCTVHAEKSCMDAAVKAAKDHDLKILSVCLLTSMAGPELQEFYNYSWAGNPAAFVLERVERAVKAGCHGTICSAHEVKAIREMVPAEFLIVVPGTRSDTVTRNDHKRTGSPRKAIEDGADYLVMGRQLINDPNPVEAFQRLVVEIS